ncbi:hypothetical protein CAP35_13295 [Chitinophagaceae bacterium IBVUCB1]|nr:hypothetical protein CAP35_13295 [Chitinophagaceae bacterium IBVUCB1]
MKNKLLLLMMCMLAGIYVHAQYGFSGRLLYTDGKSVKNKQVFLRADSTINPPWMPTFNLSTYTDTSGYYYITMPGSVVNGMKVESRTVDCNSVVLTNTHTYSGANISGSNFTICINPAPVISGQISLGTGSARAANAKVLLLEKIVDSTDGIRNYYFVKRLDSVIASSNGNYAFTYPAGITGKLLVHAMLQPTSANYSKYVPTYHNGDLQWDIADTLPKSVSYTANIGLKAANNPGGTGYITGYVQAGAGIGILPGTGLANRTIVLTDANDNPISYTLSDNIGTFSFTNLPYAGYKIFVDNYGKYSTPLLFVLGTSNPFVNHLKFEEFTYHYIANMPPLSVLQQQASSSISLFPNPATDYIHIKGMASAATVYIYDVTGRQAGSYAVQAADAQINIARLPAGSYTAKIISETAITVQQFVKQ